MKHYKRTRTGMFFAKCAASNDRYLYLTTESTTTSWDPWHSRFGLRPSAFGRYFICGFDPVCDYGGRLKNGRGSVLCLGWRRGSKG